MNKQARTHSPEIRAQTPPQKNPIPRLCLSSVRLSIDQSRSHFLERIRPPAAAAFWTNLVPRLKSPNWGVFVCGAGSSRSSSSRAGAFLSLSLSFFLSFRASPLFYFLERACDMTAAYEAMLMENFTACSVGFLMYAQKGAGGKWEMSRVWRSVRLYIPSGWRPVSLFKRRGWDSLFFFFCQRCYEQVVIVITEEAHVTENRDDRSSNRRDIFVNCR